MNNNTSSVLLTILICTANRESIVVDTIKSIRSLCFDIPIVVVDNNLNGLSQILKEKMSCFPNLVVVTEPNPGLSIARNTGVININSEWILFVDDDIKLASNFFEKLEQILDEERYDCFGGMYYPWYPQGKPAWLPAGFG
uniref:glycosyltransferase family 2 protein n=1 Tax=Lewinella sp. TaxID=2004506 RepID=UPI003D6AE273